MEQQRVVVRATFAFWLSLVVALVCVGVMLWTLVDPAGRDRAAQILPIPLVALVLGWVLLGWPAVVFGADEVEVRNPFVTIHVPLAQIETAETKHGFTIRTREGDRIQAWAAPPADRIGAWRAGDGAAGDDPRLARLPDETGRATIRTSQAPGSPSGDSALILEHQRRRADRGEGSPAPVRRRWNALNLALVAALPIALLAIGQLG